MLSKTAKPPKLLSPQSSSRVSPPHHPKEGVDSQIAREPVCEPHPGPRSIVDLAFICGEKLGMLWLWQIGLIHANRPKWLGEGAKGPLGQGSKSLKKGSCTTKTLFCTSATQHFTGAKGIGPGNWPDCTQRPFAPSPNHFGAISQDHNLTRKNRQIKLSGGVYKPVRGRFVNLPRFWDDEVGPLLINAPLINPASWLGSRKCGGRWVVQGNHKRLDHSTSCKRFILVMYDATPDNSHEMA